MHKTLAESTAMPTIVTTENGFTAHGCFSCPELKKPLTLDLRQKQTINQPSIFYNTAAETQKHWVGMNAEYKEIGVKMSQAIQNFLEKFGVGAAYVRLRRQALNKKTLVCGIDRK